MFAIQPLCYLQGLSRRLSRRTISRAYPQGYNALDYKLSSVLSVRLHVPVKYNGIPLLTEESDGSIVLSDVIQISDRQCGSYKCG